MRKLLVTTALVSCALIPVAKADLEVTIGGYTGFQAAVFNNDTANSSDRDFQSESEIFVKAGAKADNGLEYGAYVELFASTSDSTNADEANLYLAGSWGRVELGDQDGAGSELAVTSPYVGIGQVFGSYNDYVPAADRGYATVDTASDHSVKSIDSSDATKITYYTPRFNGFQAGVSFAPERDSLADGEGVQFSDATGNHDNMFELGANYKGQISNVDVKVGGAYNFADAKDGATVEDISTWTLGAQLGYMGFTFGGGYTHDGDSGQAVGTADDTVTKWNAALTYATGPWGVAASYAQVDFDDAATAFGVTGSTGSGGDYTAWGLGGTYKVAPGLTAGADLVFFDRDRVAGADADGYVLVTEVRAAF